MSIARSAPHYIRRRHRADRSRPCDIEDPFPRDRILVSGSNAANLSVAGRSGVERLRKALPRLVRPARTGFNPVRPAYCETFSGSGRRGTPGLRGADGDAEYRPPRCDRETDVGVVRSQPGRGLDHAVEGT